jgi:hypothetical protein
VNELSEWLRAQLDVDERIAQAAQGVDLRASLGPVDVRTGAPSHVTVASSERWSVVDQDIEFRPYQATITVPGGVKVGATTWSDDLSATDVAEHIARHDPARVLAEVGAKRRIIDLFAGVASELGDVPVSPYEGYASGLRDAVRLLALPYADRPGYRDEWRP